MGPPEQVRSAPPAFLAGRRGALRAFAFAEHAHRDQSRKGDRSPYIRHPVEVARLLDEAGLSGEELLAAALLHDVVEDSDATLEDIRGRFDDGVADLVAAMTEDPSIEPYERRKDAHRDQVEAAGVDAVRIYAADKLANVRDLRVGYAEEGEAVGERFKAPLDVRVRIWRHDLELAERVLGEVEMVGELRRQLDAFDAERATTVRA